MSPRTDICLVTPAHLAFNPRLHKEATALRAAGFSVAICCGDYSEWGHETDQRLLASDWRVETVAYGVARAGAFRYMRQSLVRNGLRALRTIGFETQWVAEGSSHSAYFDLAAAAKRTSAKLYVAHNIAALPAAARAARANDANYAFDAEDFHLGVEPDGLGQKNERTTIRLIESRYLKRASYVTAASPLIAEAYAETYGLTRPTVVLNVFSRSNAPEKPSPCGRAQPAPSLYWFSQTIGPGRGLETAVESIARAATRPHLYLRGTLAAGYERQLRALAGREGVADRLHFLPPAPPEDLERLGAEYDLGYSGESDVSKNRTLALSNKLFSYLTSGLAILGSDIESHRLLAPQLGSAMTLFAAGDPGALAAAVDRVLLDAPRLAAAREHAWRLGQGQFSWESEKRIFLACVERAVRVDPIAPTSVSVRP